MSAIYKAWITPASSLTKRIEVPAENADVAVQLIRATYPGCDYTRPRNVDDGVRYHQDFLATEAASLYDRVPA
jgi:hypothetical protein